MSITDAIYHWFYCKADQRVIRIYRILVGTFILASILLFCQSLKVLFTSEGYLSREVAMQLQSSQGGGNGLSIFFIDDSLWVVQIVYFVTVLSCLGLLFNFYPKLSSFISWIGYLSFYNRNPQIGYGGSEIFLMLVFFSIFLPATRSWVNSKDPNKEIEGAWAFRLIQVTVAMIYLFAAVTKMQGMSWKDGTEMLGVINSQYGIAKFYWLAEYPRFVAFATYTSTLIEFGSVFLLWFPATRLLAIVGVIILNCNITTTINVTFFPFSMLAGLSTFLISSDFDLIRRITYTVRFYFKETAQYLLSHKIAVTRVLILIVSVFLLTDNFTFSYFRICPTGYVYVPGTTNVAPFCVMKYNAKQGASGLPVSKPYMQPWTNINFYEAKKACQSVGTHYALITDRQWISIADQISSVPINNIGSTDFPIFANGNSHSVGNSLGATYSDEPYIWGCNISKIFHDPANRFIDWVCEIAGGNNSLMRKGLAGTAGMYDWQINSKPIVIGAVSMTNLRTFVLPNKEIIWDFAGNVWQFADAPFLIEKKSDQGGDFYSDKEGIDGQLPLPKQNITTAGFVEYQDIADWKGLDYLSKNIVSKNLNSKNGIGKLYLDPGDSWGSTNDTEKSQKVFLRGGAYGNPTEAGIYALNLSYSPLGTQPYIGFRCVYNPDS